MHHIKLSSEVLGNYEADGFPISVGRSSSCDFVIPNSGISRRHAQIVLDGNDCVLSDVGSSNGTFVDGAIIPDALVLESGMRIQFGTCDFTVEISTDSNPELGADEDHRISTPVPRSNQVQIAGDDHTELLQRPPAEEWERMIKGGDAAEAAPPESSTPSDNKSFLASNWPWIVPVILIPLVGWVVSLYLS